jgi:RNA polymerase sigma-70 factor (ECF subfamily)
MPSGDDRGASMSGDARVGPADEELLDRFCRGDARAFEELMRRHRAPLYNFVLRSVRHRETAEEILQDAWLRIIQGAGDFHRSAKFSTWAYTVARNLCIDHARKAALRRHPSLDQRTSDRGEGAALGDSIRDPKAVVDREAIGKELQLRLADAIGALPADQREVFVLREYSDLPFKEIAEIVGAPENTVKSRMRYALERLQDALAEYEDYARALG